MDVGPELHDLDARSVDTVPIRALLRALDTASTRDERAAAYLHVAAELDRLGQALPDTPGRGTVASLHAHASFARHLASAEHRAQLAHPVAASKS